MAKNGIPDLLSPPDSYTPSILLLSQKSSPSWRIVPPPIWVWKWNKNEEAPLFPSSPTPTSSSGHSVIFQQVLSPLLPKHHLNLSSSPGVHHYVAHGFGHSLQTNWSPASTKLPSPLSGQTDLSEKWMAPLASPTQSPRKSPHFTLTKVQNPQCGLNKMNCITWPLPTSPFSLFYILVIVGLLWILLTTLGSKLDSLWGLLSTWTCLSWSFWNHKQVFKHPEGYCESQSTHPSACPWEWKNKKIKKAYTICPIFVLFCLSYFCFRRFRF